MINGRYFLFFIFFVFSSFSWGGEADNPYFEKKLEASRGDDLLQVGFFSYRDDGYVVAGVKVVLSVLIDKPVDSVWPVFQNFNAWQNDTGYFYWDKQGRAAVHGYMEGEQLSIEVRRGGANYTYDYFVDTVIPNSLIVKHEVPRNIKGVMHTGNHVFIMVERHGKTMITMVMQHEKKSDSQRVNQLLEDYYKALYPKGSLDTYLLDDLVANLKREVMLRADQ